MPDTAPATATTSILLLTDIENSAALWELDPAAMQAALIQHDTILRQAIKLHGGVIIKTSGVALLSLFPQAPAALAAALESQQALQAAAWPGHLPPLKVRMALHCGECEYAKNGYQGPALSRVAAILSALQGAQVVVSAAFYAQYAQAQAGENQAGPGFEDLGEQYLSDLGAPLRLYQVQGPGLPAGGPGLRTLNHLPHNLPLQLKELFGREQDLEKLAALLEKPHVRLITLYGAGGVGKTRLSLQVAARHLVDFADGVYYVELSTVRQPGYLAGAIGRALNLKESAGREMVESLKQYLAGRQLLLVLDNFENLLRGASLVQELLAAAPRLKILVTSRSVLKLYGEQEYQVRPLALPSLAPYASQGEQLLNPAVRLFEARAGQVAPGFRLSPENVGAVSAICHRLDGLPLAIELVATRCKYAAPAEILPTLSDYLEISAEEPGSLAYHRTLKASIEWSYRQLEEAEQGLLARLAVFAGGCTLEAAEAVLEEVSAADSALELEIDVLDGVTSLVEKSLLYQKEAGEGLEPRFVMLSVIRDYALEKLEESGEAAALYREFYRYYLKLAEEAGPELTGPKQASWIKVLEQEHANFVAILDQSLNEGHEGARSYGPQLGLSLWRFWLVKGYITEGLFWLESILDRPAEEFDPVLRAQLANVTAVLARESGKLGRALNLLEEALAIQRGQADKKDLAATLNSLGTVMNMLGKYEESEAVHQECLEIRQGLRDQRGVALSHCNLAATGMAQGHYPEARSHYEEALTILRPLQDRRTLAMVLNNLGEIARKQGDFKQAGGYMAEGLALQRELGDKLGEAYLLHSIGALELDMEQPGKAREYINESLSMARQISIGWLIPICLESLANCALQGGRAERSVRLLGAAAELRRELQTPVEEKDREWLEELVEKVRTSLPESQFQNNWEQGQAASVEDNINYALAS